MEADFQGYASKAGLVCSDGVTIVPGAFQHQDKQTVPLVWQHSHDKPQNILGHALLENRPDGTYAYCFFNKGEAAAAAREALEHGDIKMMSIWANELTKRSKRVIHGMIREVSLVMAGANPGAVIESISIRHGDMVEDLEDEAIIYTGLEFEVKHAADDDNKEAKHTAADDNKEVQHATGDDNNDDDDDDLSVEEVYNNFSDEEKNVVHWMIGQAMESAAAAIQQSAITTTPTTPIEEGTNTVSHNVFEKTKTKDGGNAAELLHSAMDDIVAAAKKPGETFMSSLKAWAEEHLEHGITDIETLFPDAVAIDGATPEWYKRDTEWVQPFLGSIRKSPFARIKSRWADLTFDEARAKGYIKGNLKKEQFFKVSQRTTTPKTIYKKQKLDRDDILDVDEFDLVAWLKPEMRFMIEEELARAALIGDGREADDEDKIDEEHIRPVLSDDDFYTTTVYTSVDFSSAANLRADLLETINNLILNRFRYKGSGTPNAYMSELWIGRFLTIRNGTTDERMFKSLGDLATEMRVAQIIPVEVMSDVPDVVAILLNPRDYVFGATKGGQLTTFEDFDIDYNQQKFLIETRLCGALVKPKSALVLRAPGAAATLVVPVMPTFDAITGDLTITDTTGVVYKHGATTVNAAGSPYTVDPGDTWTITATPASSSYYFATSDDDEWDFTANA